MISLLTLITEGRVENFKKKYAHLPDEVKNTILKNDPSNNNKYLDWMGKIASAEKVDLNKFVKDVEVFDQYQAVLGDINKFKSYEQLKSALSSRQKSNKEKTREGADILIDNDEFLVVSPKNQDSCGYYGNRTSWCIVNQESWWNKYFYDNTIIIVLDKRDGAKYAVVGRSDYGDPTVYDKNDHSLSYSSFVGDEDYSWPEYVHEAISDYMSSDDIDSRKYKHYDDVVSTWIDDNGSDAVWESWLDVVHREYQLDKNEAVDVKVFKNIARLNGLNDEKLTEIATHYLYQRLEYGHEEDNDDLGYVSSTKEFEQAMTDRGEKGEAEAVGFAEGDYVRAKRGVTDILKIIEDAVGEQIYDKLYYKGTIDEDLFAAISKYNNMLNDPNQMHLKGIENPQKQSVKITNINDVIYVFKKTGYEQIAYYLESVLGLKEGIIKLSYLMEYLHD